MKKIPIVAVQPMRDGSVQHARAPVHAQDQRTKGRDFGPFGADARIC
jgi:hypothetical protein